MSAGDGALQKRCPELRQPFHPLDQLQHQPQEQPLRARHNKVRSLSRSFAPLWSVVQFSALKGGRLGAQATE